MTQKPRLGVSGVMFLPIVCITRRPYVQSPSTIPTPPSARIQIGRPEVDVTSPPERTMATTAASGPTPLATSFEPCANAMAHAVKIIIGVKIRSTRATLTSWLSPSPTCTRWIMAQPATAVAMPIAKAQAKLLAALRSRLRWRKPLKRVIKETTKPTRKT